MANYKAVFKKEIKYEKFFLKRALCIKFSDKFRIEMVNNKKKLFYKVLEKCFSGIILRNIKFFIMVVFLVLIFDNT